MKKHIIIALATLFLVMIAPVISEASPKKGTPEAPSEPGEVLGEYYRGDGMGYNVTLVLSENGRYSAVWHGCLGKYGEANGRWEVKEKQITLDPMHEEGSLEGHLSVLDVLRYEEGWIFVRADDRDFYDKHGISRYSVFQRSERLR